MIPRYIALCGNPKSGKSLVQQILRDEFDVQPVDDGHPLRDFLVCNLGLTWEQVSTQEGKSEFVEFLGRRWQVRELLGVLGNQLESMFGPLIMPGMAIARLGRAEKTGHGSYSFGSCRRNQGSYYKQRGGIIIGIRNPLAPPSPYEFDSFDEDIVDHWIENDALARGFSIQDSFADLHAKVCVTMSELHALKLAA